MRQSDRDAIAELQATYAVRIDRGRALAAIDVFTEDLEVNIDGAVLDREALSRALADLPATMRDPQHHLTTRSLTLVDEDSARGTVSFLVLYETPEGDVRELHGVYEDEYRRTNDGWRIHRRRSSTRRELRR